MCRLVGFLHQYSSEKSAFLLRKMTRELNYGGPDDQGFYEEDGLALGHRRLSIFDLTFRGRQPLEWKNWVLLFNGAIYNFKTLRKTLQSVGYKFRSESDTEVVLKALDKWGYDAVNKFHGMWAFALWNKNTRKLLLCRDRIGIKPLFWYQNEDLFAFASELKSFHHFPEFNKTININAVSLFLQQGYIQAPHSIFKYCHKVEPGTFVEISKKEGIKIWKYWDINNAGYSKRIKRQSLEEAKFSLKSILEKSFQLRLEADVPTGIFLSSGIDSSLLTAILQEKTNRQLKTFTIGFVDNQFDENRTAFRIAQTLNTQHTSLTCTEVDFRNALENHAFVYDEPFGDSSAIPTQLLAQLAKQSVKVGLSSDGADEIFGGYDKYIFFQKYSSFLLRTPKFFKSAAYYLSSYGLDSTVQKLNLAKNKRSLIHKIHKFQNVLQANSSVEFFNCASVFLTAKNLEELGVPHFSRFGENVRFTEKQIFAALGRIDFQTYLEGDILTKVDRATMHHALEAREPYLDSRVIEFGLSLPDNLKYKAGQSKFLLRELLRDYLPADIVRAPKKGFAIPIEKWLRNNLEKSIFELKNDKDFILLFNFNANKIEEIVQNFFQRKKYVNPTIVWYFYVLHRWYLRWIRNSI